MNSKVRRWFTMSNFINTILCVLVVCIDFKHQSCLFFISNVNSCSCKWNVKAILLRQLNKYTEWLLKKKKLTSIFTHYVSLCVDWLFMSVMAFCWSLSFVVGVSIHPAVCSCPFPSSNPGSNKRGLTSVTRAYKSPLLQMESATEWGMEVST